MVVHVTILLLIAWLRNLHVWIEQPVSSLMNFFSPFQELLTSCIPFSTVTYLGAPDFGGDSVKAIKVWSTSSRVEKLRRKKPRGLATLYEKDDSGVRGKKSLLKDSAAYPIGFGKAVASLFAELSAIGGQDTMFEDQLGAVVSAKLRKGARKRARSS